MDETYIKVKGQWKYYYRAVDKQGQTIDFLLTATRDTQAALCFLKKAINENGKPSLVNIDQSGANQAGLKQYNRDYKNARNLFLLAFPLCISQWPFKCIVR